MKRYRLLRKIMVSASLLMAGGTVMGNGCVNTLASLPICGPFILSHEQADELVEKAWKCLDLTQAAL